MSLSPNAGKDKYLLETKTGKIHYLKYESVYCKIVETGANNSTLTQTYQEAEDIALFHYDKTPVPCVHCCKE